MEMRTARTLIVVVGLLLPFLARLPGLVWHGPAWLTSYFGTGPFAVLFLSAFNALCWGTVLATSLTLKRPRSLWWPAVFGFGPLFLMHAILDLSADAQAGIALVFIPIYTVPLVLIGWLVGLWRERRARP